MRFEEYLFLLQTIWAQYLSYSEQTKSFIDSKDSDMAYSDLYGHQARKWGAYIHSGKHISIPKSIK